MPERGISAGASSVETPASDVRIIRGQRAPSVLLEDQSLRVAADLLARTIRTAKGRPIPPSPRIHLVPSGRFRATMARPEDSPEVGRVEAASALGMSRAIPINRKSGIRLTIAGI